MLPARILRQLNSVDWDFPKHFPGTSRTIHWYPGTFPAELPATLVQACSAHGDLVLDPYGGTGTSAAESIRLGRSAILADNNPIGLLAALTLNGLVILKRIDPTLSEFVLDDVERLAGLGRDNQQNLLTDDVETLARRIQSTLRTAISPDPFQFANDLKLRAEPSWRELSAWIECETLKEIRSIYRKFEPREDSTISSIVGLTMISACLRASSSQTQSWGHIADNVRPKEFVGKQFKTLCFNWIRKLRGVVRSTDVVRDPHSRERLLYLLNHDWNLPSLSKKGVHTKAKLLITSPPYANAIDYTLAQRLSLHLLGYTESDIMEHSRTEIGARRKRFSSVAETAWSESLVASLAKQIALLSESAMIALVLPHKEAGRELAAAGIGKYLLETGWVPVFRTDRSIRQSRTRQSWTSIKKEIVMIFQR